MMGVKLCFLLFVLVVDCYCQEPTVETKIGTIQGIQSNKTFRNNVYTTNAYLGIPYSKPPVGDMRFKRPLPYGNLTSPFNATNYGSPCPQMQYPVFGMHSTNEDCLFLNVFVPTATSDREERHAVMIWVHGGGLISGSGQLTPGEILAAYGNVIVVTINYRLGVFGFLNIGDERAQGNMGLWDQREAMLWVIENIASFGGDVDRITIFGESAGAVSVNVHSLYPPNKGLFHQVISQSGSARSNFGSSSPQTALARYLGCDISTSDAIFECLKKVSPEDYVNLQQQFAMDSIKFGEITFIETIDGDLIKRFPLDTIRDAFRNRSPEVEFMQSLAYINGLNGNEGLSNLIMMANGPLNDVRINKTTMDNSLIPMMLPFVFPGHEVPHHVLKNIALEYTNWTNPDDATEMFVKYAGDVAYNVESAELRNLHAKGDASRTWVYSFDAVIDQHMLPTPDWATKANHADDLAPIFGYQMDYKEAFNISNYQPPAWELDLSERMMTFWTNFAKYGNPSGNDTVRWPEFELDSMKHLVLDKTDSIEARQYAREVSFWREVVPGLLEANADCGKEPKHGTASSAINVFTYSRYCSILFFTFLLFSII
ncbi:fatty acyl-CoA hydrolase precursor, medium chain-like [Mya arenaria]|uniref:fatty acyl-CoA hydrolase precursor, medium chain-like n=1 Tax=Mya arenaria TaxID=6604 RepID=UPI0022E33916|nr:fatty acyl-CoA hydrolase precursor, medium chain-like [Mya arenaria]